MDMRRREVEKLLDFKVQSSEALVQQNNHWLGIQAIQHKAEEENRSFEFEKKKLEIEREEMLAKRQTDENKLTMEYQSISDKLQKEHILRSKDWELSTATKNAKLELELLRMESKREYVTLKHKAEMQLIEEKFKAELQERKIELERNKRGFEFGRDEKEKGQNRESSKMLKVEGTLQGPQTAQEQVKFEPESKEGLEDSGVAEVGKGRRKASLRQFNRGSQKQQKRVQFRLSPRAPNNPLRFAIPTAPLNRSQLAKGQSNNHVGENGASQRPEN